MPPVKRARQNGYLTIPHQPVPLRLEAKRWGLPDPPRIPVLAAIGNCMPVMARPCPLLVTHAFRLPAPNSRHFNGLRLQAAR